MKQEARPFTGGSVTNPDHIVRPLPQPECDLARQQREALLWIQHIIYETYHLIHLAQADEPTQPLTAAQILAKINHLSDDL